MRFIRTRKLTQFALIILLSSFASACGSGGGSSSSDDRASTSDSAMAECVPGDSDTFDQCGVVYIGLTDANGDFINYTVDVVQLALETANGRVVETLPRSTRVNFTDYVNLTELLTAATVPPATYVAGTIILSYTDAEVFVEADGEAKEAVVIDADGNTLAESALRIELSKRAPLVVRRGRPSLLQLDFDLAASHVVDIAPTPATAVAEPFVLAEIEPIDEKDIRVRGLLVEVDEAGSSYTIAVRPFRDRDGDFGRATVLTTSDTDYEIDGVAYVGADGLAALAAVDPRALTVAGGTLDVEAREFTAAVVLAGSSVPGSDRDAVVGNVIARSGDILTVRGATLLPTDRRAHFHDDITVEIGPNTRVFKDGDRASDLSIDSISIGQRVTIRGDVVGSEFTDTATPDIFIDATGGAVRMHVTRLAGTVNSFIAGQLDLTLHAIDRRRASVFDFSGTGISADVDADPENYEIGTGDLALAELADGASGKPVTAGGFPTAFGAAPPDFEGRTVVDFTDARSSLGIGWIEPGAIAPFLSIGGDGLLLANQNPEVGGRHYIRQGPILVDLTELDSDTLIVPRDDARVLFSIKSRIGIRMYTDFDAFIDDLSQSLDGSTTARSMHARGDFDAGANTLTAHKINVSLMESSE
jgi:hypothetical protein